MNINLSYTQLEKPNFVDMVFKILDDMRFPPEHICFEVTERCRLLDIESSACGTCCVLEPSDPDFSFENIEDINYDKIYSINDSPSVYELLSEKG